MVGVVVGLVLLMTVVAPRRAAGDAAQTAHPACTGDCNGDGRVTIGEILKCINMLLGIHPLVVEPHECSAIDINRNGRVEIVEIVAAVDSVLNGCPDSE